MCKRINKIVMIAFIVGIMLAPMHLHAQEAITIEGLYTHPTTGVIEDSGGESSYALGQSMVTKIVNTTAYYNSSTNTIDITFNLMNSISDMTIQTQTNTTSKFKTTTYSEISRGDDEATLRISLQSASDILRVEAYVLPMGRSVIFYIALDDEFISSNTTGSTSSNSSNSSGLIIGGVDTNQNESQSSSNTVVLGDNNYEIIVDDAFYLYAFLLLCAALVVSGAILIAFAFALKSMIGNKKRLKEIKEIKKQNVFEKVEVETQQEELDTKTMIKILEGSETNEDK